MSTLRSRKLWLWKNNPHCHWCGVLTVMVTRTPKMKPKIPFGPNEATLDHLYPMRDPRRASIKDKRNTVLACNRCNQRRNDEARPDRLLEQSQRRAKREAMGGS
jgi:hypothetical protein